MVAPNDNATILLVEDNDNDVALIRRAFRKANVPNPLTVIGDGETAVRYLAGEGESRTASATRYPCSSCST